MRTLLSRHLPHFILLLFLVVCTAGSFVGGLWAPVGIAGGIILFIAISIADKKLLKPQKDLAIMMGVFFATVALLNFQSSQVALSWHETLRMLTIFVPLLFLCSPVVAVYAQRPHFFSIIALAVTIAGIALSVQLHRMQIDPNIDVKSVEWMTKALQLAKYNRGFSYIALLVFPILASLWYSKKRWLFLPFLLVLFIPAGLTESRSAKLALMAGLAVIIVATFIPVLVRWALSLGVVVSLGWPFAGRELFNNYPDMLARIPQSWRARLEIWDYMSFRIQEKPWLGWGLGTSHTLDFTKPHGALYIITHQPAAHPHNVMTQLWVELGLPGLALGVVFAFLTLKKISTMDRRLVPFALGAWAACFCLSLIAYDFWTDSLFAAFAFTALAFMILERQPKIQLSMAAPEARQ